jgi:ribosomal protein RSM22 (predicted rRNA methylase)
MSRRKKRRGLFHFHQHQPFQEKEKINRLYKVCTSVVFCFVFVVGCTPFGYWRFCQRRQILIARLRYVWEFVFFFSQKI